MRFCYQQEKKKDCFDWAFLRLVRKNKRKKKKKSGTIKNNKTMDDKELRRKLESIMRKLTIIKVRQAGLLILYAV